MAYKRAMWRSGLTYQQPCRTCGSLVQYTDDKLAFRAWFPDGFVYCPVCKSPLRHSEQFAINVTPSPANPAVPNIPDSPQPQITQCVAPQIQQPAVNQELQMQPPCVEQIVNQQQETMPQS